MQEIVSIKQPTDALVVFIPESGRPMCHTVVYQVHIDPSKLSPSGDFIRFDHADSQGNVQSEIHGWKRVDEIEIVEILEVFDVQQIESEAA